MRNSMWCGFLLLKIARKEFPKEQNLYHYLLSNLEESGTVLAEDIEYHKGMNLQDVAYDYICFLRKNLTWAR